MTPHNRAPHDHVAAAQAHVADGTAALEHAERRGFAEIAGLLGAVR
ncbi:hypothetical protein ACIHFC_31545 [Streptomyces sp. NPDC052013]